MTSGPEDPGHPPDEPTVGFDALMADCLARVEVEGEAALSRCCAAHPEHADELRRRVGMLLDAGLVEFGAEREFPERLGEFRLLRKLGAGGMGVVYLAEQESPRRRVALKLVRPELLYFGRARQRFEREIESTGRLQHPGIVTIHAIGEDEGIPYFAMEYVEGLSLADALDAVRAKDARELTGADLAHALGIAEDAELPEVFRGSWVQVCFRLIRQAAVAVQHAHENGVLHRDLKPSNMMVTKAGRLVLLDFGLATLEGDARVTRSGTRLGSLQYMAPEQLRGEVDAIDRRSDVYSLAVTLYEMLTLRAPYSAKTEEIVRERILEGRRPPLRQGNANVSRDGEIICDKAMDSDPGERYAAASDFARDLDNVLGLRPIEGRRPSVWTRARRWARRNPPMAIATALTVLLVVGGPSVVAWLQHEKAVEVGQEKAATDESLRLAFAAIQKLGSELAQHELQQVPGTAELQLRILENALQALRGFLAARPDDDRVRRQTATAEGRLARVLVELDRPDDARAASERARKLLGQLLAKAPDDADLQFRLLHERQRLATLDLLAGRFDRAEPAFVKLHEEVVALLARHPDNLTGRDARYVICVNRAVVLRQTGRGTSIGPLVEEALEIARGLTRDKPSAIADGRLVNALTSVMIFELTGDRKRVRALGNEAIPLCEKLLRDHPGHARYRMLLGKLHNVLGTAAQYDSDHEAAVESFRASFAVREALTRDHAAVPIHWHDLGGVLHNLQKSLWVKKQRGEALKLLDRAFRAQRRAVELAGDRKMYTRRFAKIARTHMQWAVRRGDHATLEETLRDLTTLTPDEPAVFWSAGVYLAEGITAVRNDAKLSAADRRARIEQFGATAVGYLRQALARNRAQVKLGTKRLANIKQRADYQALVAEFGK